MEFGYVGFCVGGETGVPGKQPSEHGREPTTNLTHMMPRLEIEPGPHWWEAIVLSSLCHPCSPNSCKSTVNKDGPESGGGWGGARGFT